MEVRPGYKQTDVGVIPKDWDVRPLEEISPAQSVGLVVNPSSYFDVRGTVPMLLGSNITAHRIHWESAKRITETSNKLVAASRLATGDLITVRVGEPGITAVVPPELDGCNCASVMIVRHHHTFDSHWLCYVMNSKLGLEQVKHVQYGTAQKQFNISDAVNFLFPVPLLAEQEAIAEALSDADDVIESQERLLVKKRHFKQGVMQELLTGKRRLPGFSGDWSRRLLGEVIDNCSSGATPYRGRPEYYKGTVKWITSGELNYNRIIDTIEHISDEAVEKTNLKLHPVGTFLMAITGLEAAGTRGACGIVGSPATTNQSCMAIYPSTELSADFFYHYYVLRGNELALRYCQGTKQQSYTAKLVRLLPIDLPPTIEEQSAITAILFDMDAEIAALDGKLAKARRVKQGMMQELLTGRIRLV